MQRIKILMFIALFSFCSNIVLAQTPGYTSWLNVLSEIPAAFQKWISGTDKIALNQDKDKFSGIAKSIYRDLDKIILAKRKIILYANNNAPANELNQSIRESIDRVRDLQKTLDKCDALCKTVGLDALNLSGKLDFDFAQKEILLININIPSESQANKKILIVSKINEGIKILEDSKSKIDSFITKLGNN